MPAFADRVKDTTTSTGTGSITLSGSPPTGFQSFNAAYGTGVTFFYCIVGGAQWEVGQGILSAATTLVREVVTASSNAGSLVNFSAGSKDVFVTIPAFNAERMGLNGRINARIIGNMLT
jgi:hypothetical protein